MLGVDETSEEDEEDDRKRRKRRKRRDIESESENEENGAVTVGLTRGLLGMVTMIMKKLMMDKMKTKKKKHIISPNSSSTQYRRW